MTPPDAAATTVASSSRGAARRGREGFFHVTQAAEARWSLRDPDGAPFFLRAVQGVCAAPATGDGESPPDPAARLRAWGFNAVGLGSVDGAGRDDGLPWIGAVDFIASGPAIAGAGVRLPDVFDPEWPRRAIARAGLVCAPHAEERALIGWAGDAALAWGPPAGAGRPSLLQTCLSLEPGFAAYHAAWEFALALHAGRLDALAQAWGAAIANKEVVRAMTRADQGIATRGHLRDDARWTRELARRYFATTGAAIRAADPNHLVLGARSAGRAGPQVAAECVAPAVDVAMPAWGELPRAAAGAPQPLIAGEVGWTGAEFLRPLAGGRVGRLTTLERMVRRARAGLNRLARHPAVVGYAWARWRDEPGEQPPFAGGLVHEDGREAREHTELIAQFNARMGR
jgi:agarase